MKSLLTLHNIPFLLVSDENPKRFDFYEKRMHRVFCDTQVLRWGSISRHTIENIFLCFLFYCANNSIKDVAKLLRSISNHICTTAIYHNDATYHNQRNLSQLVTQHVTIDANYHNSNAKCHNATTQLITKNFVFFRNMSQPDIERMRLRDILFEPGTF